MPRSANAAENHSVSYWQYPLATPSAPLGGFSLPAGLLGGDIAAADLGSDGIPELVLGAPIGLEPLVRVLRADGSEIGAFMAFQNKTASGVAVAIGDVDGDGYRDIVAASSVDGVTMARVFGRDGIMKPDIAPIIATAPLGGPGISLALTDLDGDKKDEVIFGSASGVVGTVEVLRADGVPLGTFRPFGDAYHDGIRLAAADLDNDARGEIVVAKTFGDGAVRIFSNNAFAFIREFIAIGNGFTGGLNVATVDIDGDNLAEIIAAPNGFGGPHVHIFSGDGLLLGHFFAFEEQYRGGAVVTAARFSDGYRIIAARAERAKDARPHLSQFISVDLSEQRLRAYENGRLVKTFLVSTGLGNSTPRGDFRIMAKPEYVRYAGAGYDFGNVQYNLRFFPRYYIHTAWWHNNFGRPMSHGCVNVHVTNAKWIYEWADVGTPVQVKE